MRTLPVTTLRRIIRRLCDAERTLDAVMDRVLECTPHSAPFAKHSRCVTFAARFLMPTTAAKLSIIGTLTEASCHCHQTFALSQRCGRRGMCGARHALAGVDAAAHCPKAVKRAPLFPMDLV